MDITEVPFAPDALQLRGAAGERQVRGTPRVGYAQLYGAPGTAGGSILST